MILPLSFATQTITRLRGTEDTDGLGNTVLDWTAPDELDLTGCSVQPVAAPETVDGRSRDAVGRRWLVIAPPGADIGALDRARFSGRVYDVDGEPLAYSTGVLDHVELYLVDVAG
jgi:hypothetical protein